MRIFDTHGKILPVDKFMEFGFQESEKLRWPIVIFKTNENMKLCDCGNERWECEPCHVCGEE